MSKQLNSHLGTKSNVGYLISKDCCYNLSPKCKDHGNVKVQGKR